MDNRTRNLLLVWGTGFILILSLLRYLNIINSYQFVELGLVVMLVYLGAIQLFIARAQTEAALESVTASKESTKASIESMRASVAPNIIFRIRPANHYWNGPFGRQPSTWKSGVGIYFENVGLGQALNVKMSYRAVGEKDEHKCKADFSELRAGIPSTLPSKDHPELEVKETHKQIIIDSIEYDDIRIPPNHYRIDEPKILEINSAFFEEPDKLITRNV